MLSAQDPFGDTASLITTRRFGTPFRHKSVYQVEYQANHLPKCDVYPVYRDPVHDFGILRFDPKAIKYMPVTELELRPDLART